MDKIIKEEAQKVWSRLEGSVVFGQQVDFHNLDLVVLAAYLLGQQDATNYALNVMNSMINNAPDPEDEILKSMTRKALENET